MKASLIIFGLLIMLTTQIAPAEADRWIINGNVLNKTNRQPLAGVRVTAYDRDRMRDDLLGQAMTDQRGNFTISFRSRDFTDEKNEKFPAIYIKIRNQQGQLIYNSRKRPRLNSKRNEFFQISIYTGKKKGIYRRHKNPGFKIYRNDSPKKDQ